MKVVLVYFLVFCMAGASAMDQKEAFSSYDSTEYWAGLIVVDGKMLEDEKFFRCLSCKDLYSSQEDLEMHYWMYHPQNNSIPKFILNDDFQ